MEKGSQVKYDLQDGPLPKAQKYDLQDGPIDGTKEPSFGKNVISTGRALGARAIDYAHREGMVLAGGLAGAAEGFALGTPAGPIGSAAGAVGGAFIGGVSGKALSEASDAAINAIAPGLAGKSKTPGEVIKNARESGESMALAEVAGRGIGNVAKGIGGALLPPIEKRAPALVKAVKNALSANILPSPAQIMQSRPVAILEEMASKFPFIGARVNAMRQEEQYGLNAMKNAVLSSSGEAVEPVVLGTQTDEAVSTFLHDQLTKRQVKIAALHQEILSKHGDPVALEELGRQLDGIRTAKDNIEKATNAKFYKAVHDAIPPSENAVPDINYRKLAEQMDKELRSTPNEYPQTLRGYLQNAKAGRPAEEIQPGVSIPGKEYTYQEMSSIVSGLTQRIKEEGMKSNPFGKSVSGSTTPEGLKYIKLKAAAIADMDAFSAQLPEDVKGLKSLADANYRSYKEAYSNPAMSDLGKLAKTSPEMVYNHFVKPNNVSDIRRLKNIVGEEGMVPFRRKFVDDMITGPDGKMLLGQQISRNMAHIGPGTMKEILTPKQYEDLAKSASTLELPGFVETEVEHKLRKLITSSGGHAAPEDIVKRVVNGDSITIKALSKIVGPEGMQPYKRAIIEDIIGTTPKPDLFGNPGEVSPRISKNLESYGRTLDYMFTPKEIAEIRKVDDVRALLQSTGALAGNYSGTAGTLLAGGGMGGAIAGTMLHPMAGLGFILNNPVTSIAVPLEAYAISRLYTSRAGRELLISGMTPKMASSMDLYSRLSSFVTNAMWHQYKESTGKITPSPDSVVALADASGQPTPTDVPGDLAPVETPKPSPIPSAGKSWRDYVTQK